MPNASQALTEWKRWRSGAPGAAANGVFSQAHSLPARPLVVLLATDQYERWRRGDRVPVEQYFDHYPQVRDDHEAACDLVYGEYLVRELIGESPDLQEYLDRFPGLADGVRGLHAFERFTGTSPWFPMSVVEPPCARTLDEPTLRDDTLRHPANRRDEAAVPDYELIRKIGSGAFGQVWIARNRHDRGFCAVKVVCRWTDVELSGVRLYRALASDSPYLVPIKHVGEVEGYYYYVMPLADDARGDSLPDAPELYEPMTLTRAILDRKGPASMKEVRGVGGAVLRALAQFHARGACHCDVKPDNIMRIEGAWRLGDVGLARTDAVRDSDRGTVAYWPPEGPKDHTADLYALGKTLFQFATGARLDQFSDYIAGTSPFTSSRPNDLALRSLIARACHAETARRYQSADEMREALDRIGAARSREWFLIGTACLILIAGAFFWAKSSTILGSHRSAAARPEVGGSVATYWADRLTDDDRVRMAALDKRIHEAILAVNWSEAAKAQREAVEIVRQKGGPDCPELVTSEDHLRRYEDTSKLPRAAQEGLTEAYRLIEKVRLLVDAGKLEDALREERRIAELRVTHLGSDNYIEVAQGLIYIGSLELQIGLRSKSEPLRSEHLKQSNTATRHAIEILERLVGRDDRDTAKAYHNLGRCLLEQGQPGEAELYLNSAVETRRRVIPRQWETAIAQISLARCLRLQAKANPGVLSRRQITRAQNLIRDAAQIAEEYEKNARKSQAELDNATGERAEVLGIQVKQYRDQAKDIRERIAALDAPTPKGR